MYNSQVTEGLLVIINYKLAINYFNKQRFNTALRYLARAVWYDCQLSAEYSIVTIMDFRAVFHSRFIDLQRQYTQYTHLQNVRLPTEEQILEKIIECQHAINAITTNPIVIDFPNANTNLRLNNITAEFLLLTMGNEQNSIFRNLVLDALLGENFSQYRNIIQSSTIPEQAIIAQHLVSNRKQDKSNKKIIWSLQEKLKADIRKILSRQKINKQQKEKIFENFDLVFTFFTEKYTSNHFSMLTKKNLLPPIFYISFIIALAIIYAQQFSSYLIRTIIGIGVSLLVIRQAAPLVVLFCEAIYPLIMNNSTVLSALLHKNQITDTFALMEIPKLKKIKSHNISTEAIEPSPITCLVPRDHIRTYERQGYKEIIPEKPLKIKQKTRKSVASSSAFFKTTEETKTLPITWECGITYDPEDLNCQVYPFTDEHGLLKGYVYFNEKSINTDDKNERVIKDFEEHKQSLLQGADAKPHKVVLLKDGNVIKFTGKKKFDLRLYGSLVEAPENKPGERLYVLSCAVNHKEIKLSSLEQRIAQESNRILNMHQNSVNNVM